MAHLVIGVSGAQLALGQAQWVKQKLELLHPGLLVGIEILAIATTSDADAWRDEILAALNSRRVDAVVHHFSELPIRLPEEIHLAAVTERGDVRDVLLAHPDLQASVKSIADLPPKARVIADSQRRQVQLHALRADLRLVEGRGDLSEELSKFAQSKEHALVTDAFSLALLAHPLAANAIPFTLAEILPAPGQGALALESLLTDQRTNMLLEALNHWPTRFAANAERAVLRNLYGEVRQALAAHAQLESTADGTALVLQGFVSDADGTQFVRGSLRGEPRLAETLGANLALQLLNDGARALLERPEPSHLLAVEELYPLTVLPEIDLLASEPAAAPAADALTNGANGATVPALPAVAGGKAPAPSPAAPASSVAVKHSAGNGATNGSTVNALFQPTHLLATDARIFAQRDEEFDILAAKAERARAALPLRDRRILLARASPKDAELIAALNELGASVEVCPTVRAIEPNSWDMLDRALRHLSWYEWITFTSRHSVQFFLQRLDALGHHRSEVEARRLCAIGAATAEQMRREDLNADLMLTTLTAESITAGVMKKYGVRERLRGTTMLLVTSQATRDELRPALDKLGMYVEAVESYGLALASANQAAILTGVTAGNFDYVIFNSAASVENLAVVLFPTSLANGLRGSAVFCTSEEAAASAHTHQLPHHLVGKEYSLRQLIQAIRRAALQHDALRPTHSTRHAETQ